MAWPYNPPVKNEDFKVRVAIRSGTDALSFKSNPTIVTGDFKVDKDGVGLVNLTTLPTVSPSGSVLVLIELSATEMNADVVTIVGVDQTNPKEWCDIVISIPTASA